MNFINLTEVEYLNFIQSKDVPFQNTQEFIKQKKSNGWGLDILGVIQDSKIISAALIFSVNQFGGKYFDCHYGPIMDYTNQDLVEFFFTNLKGFLKTNKAISFMFNPDIIISTRDILGGPQKTYDYSELSTLLSKLGYKQHNSTKDTNGLWNMRWFFKKDLTNLTHDTLIASFKSQGKRSSKKSLNNNLFISEINTKKKDQITLFTDLMNKSALKQDFSLQSVEYYKKFKENYGSMAKLMLVHMDVASHKNDISQKILNIENELQKTIKENKKNQLLKQKQGLEKDLSLIKNSDAKLYLSAGLFIENKNELVYLFGGNDDTYARFCSSFYLQTKMMEYAISKQISTYNFYGIDGNNLDKDNILKFKQGFDGYITELIPSYEIIINKPKYYLLKIKHKIK